MRLTKGFIFTQKNTNNNIEATSHALSLRAGLMHQVGAGLYDFLPLGQKVVNKIENIVRQEMDKSGALEISMPVLQPSDLWLESGRWDVYGDEMFKLRNRDNREFCLGPTHEESVCQLARAYLKSYKDLPVTLYQIGKKFRDELRPRHGLLRAKEFLMKDAYSFDRDEAGLDTSYNKMREAYLNTFKRLGLDVAVTNANPGEIGGSGSEEFLAFAKFGEDKFIIKNNVAVKLEDLEEENVEKILTGIEVGHIFKLGDKYSAAMNVKYADSDGKEKPAIMGCYGIGVSRLLSAIIEQNNDEKGIVWPRSVAPYDVLLLPLQNTEKVMQQANKMYDALKEQNIDVLLDDRDIRAGVKFKDADLIGIPYKIIIGKKFSDNGLVEVENRSTQNKFALNPDQAIENYRDI